MLSGWILLEGCEVMDEQARKGGEMPLCGLEPFCGIGKGFMVKRQALEGLFKFHQGEDHRMILLLIGHCRLNFYDGMLEILTDTQTENDIHTYMLLSNVQYFCKGG